MKTTTQSTIKPRVRKDYLIPEALWNEIKPLLPKQVTHHPLGCHRKRVDDRSAMDAIFFVLKTGCQWNALNATGICSSSSAHRRFQEGNSAGVMNYPAARPRGIKTILTAVAPPLACLDFSRSFPLPANFRVPPPWRHSNRLSKTPLPIALSSPS